MRREKLEVTGGALLMLAGLNYLDSQGIVPLALLACAFHEGGHLLAIRLLGGGVRRMRLTAAGAELRLDRPLTYGGELLAVLAGPAVNLLLALVFCRLPGGALFAGLNLVLACFNLLPVGRLDGGRALRCLVSWLFGPETAHWIGMVLDRIFIIGLLLLGVFLAQSGGTVTLLVTSCWLFSAMKKEKGRKRACHILRKQVK